MHFKRLKIKDFGPIREIEFNFEQDKVYHFISGNDSGKSMILDAMNILCNNIAGIHVKKYVSDYADNFFIEGEDFDGNIIQLQRGEISYYNLIEPDGTATFFDKIGGNVPVRIQNITNIYVDELKGEQFNFRYSDDKILFMNTTAGENYSFFQKALRTDKVLNALKKANKIQNTHEKEIDITRSKIEFEEDKLASNPDITYIKDEIELYRESIKETLNTTKLVYEVISENKKLDKLDSINIPQEIMEYNWQDKRKDLKVITYSKDIIVDTLKSEKLDMIINTAQSMAVESVKARELFGIIDKLNDIIKLNKKLTNINKNIKTVEETEKIWDNVKEQAVAMRETKLKISKVDSLTNLKSKEQIVDKLIDSVNAAHELSNKCNISTRTTEGIKELTDQLDTMRGQTELIDTNQQLMVRLDKERTEFMLEHNFCPVVVNSLDKTCPFSKKTLADLVGGK